MKKYCLPLAAFLLLALTACKKNSGEIKAAGIPGKWQQTKLELRQTDDQGMVHDTVFKSANFTTNDFYQFNGDKTAIISKSGNFSFAGKSIVINANQISDWVTHYTYSIAADTVLNLNPTDQIINPGNSYLQKQQIIQLDNSHLVLRSVYSYYWGTTYNIAGSKLTGIIATSFFTKL